MSEGHLSTHQCPGSCTIQVENEFASLIRGNQDTDSTEDVLPILRPVECQNPQVRTTPSKTPFHPTNSSFRKGPRPIAKEVLICRAHSMQLDVETSTVI